ncbi:hypothetical protein EDM00_11105 [Ornithobacterium rhinotracheale]|uniref:tape measure protein n=1 Tax=Ornithobacterium rhinotracheale TaxID=28251 RepID=UPI00129C75F9|nr:tape measure protein [Ornithobacterium rhinotracheale]MRI64528.1 hypothetical protein [Ornithobacterium rhinotracheale]MRJ11508.1 hypothetical protein [Ornithobacterium rhinotracheale]
MSYSFSLFLKDFASSSIAKISSGLGTLENKLRNSQSKLQNNFNKSVKSIDELNGKLNKLNAQRTAATSISDIRRLKTEINRTERQIRKLENLPPKGFTERLRSLGGQFGGLVGLAGGVGLAIQAWSGIKALFGLGVELEQTNIKFEVLLGSLDASKKMLGELNSYANLTPYSNEAIIKNSELMLSFGIAQDKIMPNMKMLGDIAMGNEQKLNGLSLAYSQVQSTGRLMGQDLLQMINQGFNPLQIISQNTGIAMGDLKKKMEEGAISAQMVEEAFRLATSEGGLYYGMADRMAESAGGKWSTFLGTLKNVVMRIGLKFAEWIKPIFDIGTAFVGKIIPFGQWILGFLPSLENFTLFMQILGIAALGVGVYMLIANASTIALSIALGILEGIIWLVETAQWAWNLAMSMNPIGLVVAAIVVLIGVVVLLWNKFAWFRGAILGVWEVLKGLGNTIKNYVVNRFKEMLSGIMGIGQALVKFFSGDFTGAIKTGGEAIKNLMGKDSAAQAISDGKKAFENFNVGWEAGEKAKPISAENITNFSGKLKGTQTKSKLFDELMNGETDKDKKGKKHKTPKAAKDKAGSVISGGTRKTDIHINIQNLGTDTKIYVSSANEGISNLGQRLKEELLRVVNSANQMQTM